MNETVLIVLPSGQFLAVDRAKVSHKSRDYCHLYDGHFAVASGPMREALDVREVLAAHCREVPRAGKRPLFFVPGIDAEMSGRDRARALYEWFQAPYADAAEKCAEAGSALWWSPLLAKTEIRHGKET